MESKFSLEGIEFSTSSIWGPDQTFVLEEYKHLPFSAYNKLEKLGRFADLANASGKPTTAGPTTTAAPFAEDEEYTVIEGKANLKKDKPKKKPLPVLANAAKPQQQNYTQNRVPKGQSTKSYRPAYNKVNYIKTKFKDNAGVQADWEYITDIAKANFDKTPAYNVKVADLLTVGRVPIYDKTWDVTKLAGKKTSPFLIGDTVPVAHSIREDKFIMDQVSASPDPEETIIYTTDTLLSTLLTVKASVFPWDISVFKDGNKYFFEPSKTNKVSYVNLLTVNENTAGNLPEDEKDMLRICVDSTNVSRQFVNLSAKENEFYQEGADSEYAKDVPTNRIYKYRKWTVDGKTHVVCRSEIESCVKPGDGESKPVYAKVGALSEFEPEKDWKSNYETNRGALLSSEYRNNSCKITKWLCQAALADCEFFKLGFATKASVKEPKYQVLTVEAMTTNGLSKTLNYVWKDNWSIIKTVVEILSKQEDGEFSFVKLPYKQSIRIYRLPDNEEGEDA